MFWISKLIITVPVKSTNPPKQMACEKLTSYQVYGLLYSCEALKRYQILKFSRWRVRKNSIVCPLFRVNMTNFSWIILQNRDNSSPYRYEQSSKIYLEVKDCFGKVLKNIIILKNSKQTIKANQIQIPKRIWLLLDVVWRSLLIFFMTLF